MNEEEVVGWIVLLEGARLKRRIGNRVVVGNWKVRVCGDEREGLWG